MYTQPLNDSHGIGPINKSSRTTKLNKQEVTIKHETSSQKIKIKHAWDEQ